MHLLTHRSVATVAETTNELSSTAGEVVAARKPMKQTGVVGHNHLASRTQSLRTVIFLTLIALASACHQRKSNGPDNNESVEVMVPAHAAYTGAFIDFGEADEDVTLEGSQGFETV